MRKLILLSATALIASCTPQPPAGQSPFARDLAQRTAGAPQACVSTMANQNLYVIDQMTVAYGQGQTIYVNHLGAACPALSPLNTLMVDVQSGQYCRGDRVRGLEPGATIPGPTCNLGDWTPYTLNKG